MGKTLLQLRTKVQRLTRNKLDNTEVDDFINEAYSDIYSRRLFRWRRCRSPLTTVFNDRFFSVPDDFDKHIGAIKGTAVLQCGETVIEHRYGNACIEICDLTKKYDSQVTAGTTVFDSSFSGGLADGNYVIAFALKYSDGRIGLLHGYTLLTVAQAGLGGMVTLGLGSTVYPAGVTELIVYRSKITTLASIGGLISSGPEWQKQRHKFYSVKTILDPQSKTNEDVIPPTADDDLGAEYLFPFLYDYVYSPADLVADTDKTKIPGDSNSEAVSYLAASRILAHVFEDRSADRYQKIANDRIKRIKMQDSDYSDEYLAERVPVPSDIGNQANDLFPNRSDS